VPDRGIKIIDALLGWNGLGDNPLQTYMFNVEYDANAQKVIWMGDDDRNAEGVFQLRRFGKPRGKRFGSPLRLL